MKKYNWGIISTAGIAGMMSEMLNKINGYPPAAVASRSLERAKKFAADHNIEKVYGSYEELAQDPDIDIIYIATPMNCHFENSLLCLKHGKSVLCEKAVTVNSEQLKILINEAEKRGLLFMEAMWTKTLPSYLKAIEWIKEGRIGDVRMLKADFLINIPCFDPKGRMFASDLGGGALLDLGSYAFHFVCGIMGMKPDEIRTKAHVGVTGVDFDSVTELVYGDASAYVTLGFDMEGKSTANIVGTKGSIFFDANFPHTSHIKLKDEYNRVVEDLNIENLCDGHEYQLYEAQKALGEGRTSSELIPYEDSLAVMELMDELRRRWGLRYTCE